MGLTTKCILGLHEWKYIGENVYDMTYPDLRLLLKPQKRCCTHCGKTQVYNVHCLGLNPPSYVESWENVTND